MDPQTRDNLVLAALGMIVLVIGTLVVFGAGQATGVAIFGGGEYVSYKLTTPSMPPSPPDQATTTPKPVLSSDAKCVKKCTERAAALRGASSAMDDVSCTAACDGVKP